jgi:hypothetical protein
VPGLELPDDARDLADRLSAPALTRLWAGHPEELSWLAMDSAQQANRQVIAHTRIETAQALASEQRRIP